MYTQKEKETKKKEKKRDFHKQVITKGLHFACGNISNLEAVLDFLTSNGALTIDECEQITSNPTPTQKCRCMLMLFHRKSEDAFETLLAGLIETSHAHVAVEFDRLGQEIQQEQDEQPETSARK